MHQITSESNTYLKVRSTDQKQDRKLLIKILFKNWWTDKELSSKNGTAHQKFDQNSIQNQTNVWKLYARIIISQWLRFLLKLDKFAAS